MARYKTFIELGREVQRKHPSLSTRDPEELGRKAAEKYGIDVREGDSFASKAFSDIGQTLGEDVGGVVDAISSPVQTGKGLLKLLGGAADLNLGTDFVDEQDEEMARGAGNQFIDEIKDWENRPVRALSNISIFAGPLGAAGKVGKLGRVAKAANIAEFADPLTAVTRVGGKAISGAAKGVAKPIQRAAQAISRDDTHFGKEYAANILGLVNSKGPRAMQLMWDTIKDPEARKEVVRISKLADPLGETESVFIQATDKLVEDRKAAYDNGIAELGARDAWLTPVTDDTGQLIADIFNTAFKHDEFPIAAEVKKIKVEKAAPDMPTISPDFLKRDGGVGDIIEEVPDEFTYRISFDDSQISEGTKRPITQAFNRARDWAKENPNATQQDLDGFKKGLSDEIESMGLDPEGVTGKAKGALINIKDSYRDILHQDPEYARVMEQYSKSSKVMDDVERFLEYDFRNSSTTGKAGEAGRRQKHLGNRLGRVFDSGDSNAGKREEVMRTLETETGDSNIFNRQLGAELSDFMGGGLVGRAEMSQGARRLWSAAGGIGTAGVGVGIATGSALLGSLATIPAFIILSPRATLATASLLMRMGMDGKKAKKIAAQVGDDGEKWRALLKSRGIDPSQIIQKMKDNKTTVADLIKATRKPAQQERRLEEDNPKPKNIFRTLGR